MSSLPDTADVEILRRARSVLESIADPELPMLTIVDLGILREIRPYETGVEVVMLPTYPGCPALDMVAAEINRALTQAGIFPVKVTMAASPVWTTDLMSPESLRKLRDAGVAPPERNRGVTSPPGGAAEVEEVAPFGHTACRAIWRCLTCGEGFDRFKCN